MLLEKKNVDAVVAKARRKMDRVIETTLAAMNGGVVFSIIPQGKTLSTSSIYALLPDS
jgi:hypothetical protein